MAKVNPMPQPVVVLGLGNPGPEYEGTRHNLGAMAVVELARINGLSLSRGGASARRLQSLWANGLIREGDLTGGSSESRRKGIVALPLTFMNLSGRAARAILEYFDLGVEHLVVAHDDLDLDLGRMKVAKGGGAAGHKGVHSIIEELGTERFVRLKLGIGRPRYREMVEEYVLSGFYADQRALVEQVVEQAAGCLGVIAHQGPDMAMAKFHRSTKREVDG